MRRDAVLFHVPENVLVDDHGIVDHNADRENQPEHRHDVEREASPVDERESRHDRGRNRQAGNECGAPILDEEQNRDRHQNGRHHQVEIHLLDRPHDVPRLVLHDERLNIGREQLAELLESLPDAFHHRHRVASRLLLNDQTDGIPPVEPGETAGFFERVFDATDVADAHRVSILVGHDQIQEPRGTLHTSHGPQHQLARPLIDPAAGQFQVLANQGLPHVFNRQVAARQLVRVDHDIDGPLPATHDDHRPHTRYAFQILLDALAQSP